MRTTSLSVSSSQKSSKPAFQTKLKHRTSSNNKAVNDSLLRSLQSEAVLPPSRPAKSFAEQENFQVTARRLSHDRFNNHEANNCMCGECTCGRHLCQLKPIKPEFTKTTVYKQQFERKSVTPSLVLHADEYDRLQGPHLEMASTYSKGFTGKDGDKLERPKPDDLIHSAGPGSLLTNYSHQFPGHKGGNQYVKPTDRHHRGGFPLRSKSTYSSTYLGKSVPREGHRPVDLLKTGNNWMGQTTYKQKYSEQNPEYYALKVKLVEKQEINPNYKRQYGNSRGMQRPSIEMISCKRTTRYALQSGSWREKGGTCMINSSTNSRRTATSRQSQPTTTPYRPINAAWPTRDSSINNHPSPYQHSPCNNSATRAS